MLATGGTLVAAIDLLLERGARDVTAICLLAAPEGLKHMEEAFAGRDAEVTVVTAALDERLNEKGYIVPGPGRCRRPPLRRRGVARVAPLPGPLLQIWTGMSADLPIHAAPL